MPKIKTPSFLFALQMIRSSTPRYKLKRFETSIWKETKMVSAARYIGYLHSILYNIHSIREFLYVKGKQVFTTIRMEMNPSERPLKKQAEERGTQTFFS
jgi:hypothetical protein